MLIQPGVNSVTFFHVIHELLGIGIVLGLRIGQLRLQTIDIRSLVFLGSFFQLSNRRIGGGQLGHLVVVFRL